MLLNLLPGLRDLRAPLATGFLWLATLWVLLRAEIDPSQSADGSLLGDLSDLSASLGSPATFAGLTFTAYLVGIATTSGRPPRAIDQTFASIDARRYGREVDLAIHSTLGRFAAKVLRPFGTFGDRGQSAGPYEIAWESILPLHDGGAVLDIIAVGADPELPVQVRRRVNDSAEHFSERMGGEVPDDYPYRDASVVSMAVAEGLSTELPALANRLQIERETIFNRYDRMVAESEFRLTCALPLAALIGAIAYELSSPLPLLAMVFPLVIFVLGVRRYYAARSVIWEAVAQDLIQSDTLTTIRRLVSDALAGERPRDTTKLGK